MMRPPPRYTPKDTHFPYATLFRSAGRRQAEYLADEGRHRVSGEHAVEHEIIARVGAHFLDLALDPHERRRRGRLVELAHLVLQYVEQVGKQIGDRRIDRDLAHPLGQPVLLPRLEQAFGQHVAIALPLAPLRSEEHTSELQSLMRISYAV